MGRGVHERIIREILDARNHAAQSGDCLSEVVTDGRFGLRFGDRVVDADGVARRVFQDAVSRAISGNFPAILDCLLRDLRAEMKRVTTGPQMATIRGILDRPYSGENAVHVFMVVGDLTDRREYAEAFAAAIGPDDVFVDLFDIPGDRARDWQVFDGMQRPVYVSARYDFQAAEEVEHAGVIHATLAKRAGRDPILHLIEIIPRGGDGFCVGFSGVFQSVDTIRADADNG